MATVKTKKGTELPLTNLKGKNYLMVAYRLQWLSEDVDNYTIDTLTERRDNLGATVSATVTLLDKDGKVTRRATARKTETSKDFGDFEEKAETGAIGRALAMLGFGTQHALSDLDEGTRIVDSPLQQVSATATPSAVAVSAGSTASPPTAAVAAPSATPRRSTSFKARSASATVLATTPSIPPTSNGKAADGWD